ncbi:hypothetical protein KY284_014251 [Solanum tuberosum]|nr:hypothetical protein KY284_014251 [Solanum tuberosum]
MDIIIVTRFHHGGKFVEGTSGGGLTYIGESEVEYVDPTTNNFVLVDNDFSLLNLIKDLGDGYFLDLYVQHVLDEVEVIKDGVSTGSSQPPSSRKPTSSGQPVGSSQPPTWRSQHVSSGQQSTSICDDTSIVRRVQQAERGRGRGRGKGRGRRGDDTSTVTGGQQAGRGRGREGASTSTGGNKRPKTVGFGIYTDDISGRQTLNALIEVSCIHPGTTGERVVTPVVFKCATPTNIDIGYKSRGLK